MRFSNQTAQGGQSFTLDVRKTDAGTFRVSAPHVPDIAPVEDASERFAIQEMRRRLDESVFRTSGGTPLILPGGDDY